jgi:hypothetical protein
MKKFSTILTESKNTHMEHIEDMIFNEGSAGARRAINSLRNLRDMLAGSSSQKVNATVKWDGAPAIFAGIDPSDGKFFVAKKGIFNVSPKLYKTQADINRELSGELKDKFTIALREFSKLGIKQGVYQGDLLFTKGDVAATTISDEKMFTFHPNTIVYAVPATSGLGQRIRKASIGIVWHTSYSGRTLKDMKASFGKGITNKMRKVPSVFMDDATYQDVTGNAKFTAKETTDCTALISQAGKMLGSVSGDILRMVAGDEELKQKIKTYNNTYVRAGTPFPNPQKHVRGLYNYIEAWYDKEIETKKQQKTKDAWTARKKAVLGKVFGNVGDLTNIFAFMNLVIKAKQMIIDKMNRASNMRMFLKTRDGFKVTNPEGFVAIDKVEGAVKLVDRLQFSYANFSPEVLKGWQK